MSHQYPEQPGADRRGEAETARHDDAYERPGGQYDRGPGAGQYGWGGPQQQGRPGSPDAGWSQPPYGAPGHGDGYGYGYGWGRPSPEAQSKATASLVLGIVGVATGPLGIVLGPIGLVQARRAQELGADATAGRVLSWIAVGIGGLTALWFLFVAFMMIVTIATTGSVLEDSTTSRAMAATAAGLAPLAAALRA